VAVRIDNADPDEIGRRAANFTTANGIQVVWAQWTVHPNTFELVVDGRAKSQIEALTRELEKAKVFPLFRVNLLSVDNPTP
jgi:hypothetical protein